MPSTLERFQNAKRAILENGQTDAYREIESIAANRTPVGHMATDFLRRHPRHPATQPAPRQMDTIKIMPAETRRLHPNEIPSTHASGPRRDGVTLAELEAEIARVEKVRVLLTSANRPDTKYRPYSAKAPSAETMSADDLTRMLGRAYPGIDCLSPRGAISLGTLRRNYPAKA
ncbi:hypothetical protein LCM17_19695 [Cereibacter sphaeroides]|nr:hypothetical protein [Cereibacter sphaeroides]